MKRKRLVPNKEGYWWWWSGRKWNLTYVDSSDMEDGSIKTFRWGGPPVPPKWTPKVNKEK